MARFLLCLWLSLLAECAAEDAVTLVQLTQAANSAALAAARSRARSAASWLSRALLEDPELVFLRPPTMEELVRSRLAREADYLASEDGTGSQILRGYARQAPFNVIMQGPLPLPSLAVAPALAGAQLDAPYAAQRDEQPDEELFDAPYAQSTERSNEESYESTMRTDSEGRQVRHIRHCKNGLCDDRMELLPSQQQEALEVPEAFSFLPAREPLSPASYASAHRVRRAARHLARELREISEGLGAMPSAEALLGDLFGARRIQERPPPALAWEREEPAERTAHSESMSTETIYQNGRTIRKTTKCVDGQCETTEEAEEAEEAEQEAPQQTAEKKGGDELPVPEAKRNVTLANMMAETWPVDMELSGSGDMELEAKKALLLTAVPLDIDGPMDLNDHLAGLHAATSQEAEAEDDEAGEEAEEAEEEEDDAEEAEEGEEVEEGETE